MKAMVECEDLCFAIGEAARPLEDVRMAYGSVLCMNCYLDSNSEEERAFAAKRWHTLPRVRLCDLEE